MTRDSSASRPLYIFTTSQSPLAARYPRPSKSALIVPPLVHRSLHLALDQTPPSIHSIHTATAQAGLIIPHPDQLRKHAPDHDEIEVTLKIHLVGDASAKNRSQWVIEALELLDRHLGLKGADTMLIGFSGVDYKGKKTVNGDSTSATASGSDRSILVNGTGNGSGAADIATGSEAEYAVSSEIEQDIVDLWSSMTEGLGQAGRKVKRVGTMYLPLSVLKRLKQVEGGLEVEVNSLDTPDCHHLPKDYTAWARENGIQLWAGGGGEGSDPLPSAELHNILQEFASHLADQSGQPLSQLIQLDGQGQWDASARRGVAVKWVMGYTVVSSSRNVVEDKGYVVAADLL